MSRRLFSQSFLRGIFEETRKTRMLMSSHRPPPSPASEIRSLSTFHLPDVQAPTQYLIGMGIRPALACRLSNIYVEFVARYRQVFESYFRRAIQGNDDLHLEHYRDIFVVQFKGTIQVLGSQFMSAIWVWLCQAGLPTLFWPQSIDVRVDAVTKAHILSRTGLGTASSIMDVTSDRIELPGEERKTEGSLPTKMLPASVPPPLRLTAPSTRDLFHSEKSSTKCFPAYYPPPPGEPNFSPRKTLITQFKLTPSARNEKSVANCSVDVPSLTTIFGKMSVTTPEAGLKTQENRKCAWAPSFKTSEAPPLLSPVTASMSGSPQNSQSKNSEVVSSVKSITKPRKRRIAALPKRPIKATTLPTRDPSLPPAANSPISRIPSLISDTSSCADSPSSSDELDTPPSTPPSHLPALIAYNASPTTATSSKSKTVGPFGLPIRTNSDFLRPRRGEGIRIDFTNGEGAGGQQFSFAFST
ncbi:hypothetical protein V8E52_001376 [Russula decolorans]